MRQLLAMIASNGDHSHLDDHTAVQVDIAIHALAIAMATAALPYTKPPVTLYLSIVLAMFIASAAYNLTRKWWLRRLDHASIGVLAVTTVNAFVPPTVTALPYIAMGGAFYLLGMQFLTRPHLRFHNAIWHSLVIAACACHYEALI